MIRNCVSFTHKFSVSSGALDETQVVVASGSLVLSSIFSSLEFNSHQQTIPDGPIGNVPRINLIDSDDNVVFGVVPILYNTYFGLQSANSVQNSNFFQIPGKGLFLENGLKVNALAPTATPNNTGVRITVNLVYQV